MTLGFDVVDVNSARLDYARVALDAITAGAPCTGTRELEAFAGVEVGIWEMTEGGMRDIEAEELFVVTAGNATLVIHHQEGRDETIQLVPGALVRLSEGLKTTWAVTSPLRKVYFLPPTTGSLA